MGLAIEQATNGQLCARMVSLVPPGSAMADRLGRWQDGLARLRPQPAMRGIGRPRKAAWGLAGSVPSWKYSAMILPLRMANHGIGIDPVRKDEVQAAPLLIGWIERPTLARLIKATAPVPERKVAADPNAQHERWSVSLRRAQMARESQCYPIGSIGPAFFPERGRAGSGSVLLRCLAQKRVQRQLSLPSKAPSVAVPPGNIKVVLKRYGPHQRRLLVAASWVRSQSASLVAGNRRASQLSQPRAVASS